MHEQLTNEWLDASIATMRKVGNDTQRCEVKEAGGGFPKSTLETLSAFSNGSGGYLILGLSEKNNFEPVDNFDPRSMQDALISACNAMTPAVRPETAILEVEGAPVLCAYIHEMLPRDKPCYITARGAFNGSFIRVGDGDRRLTGYEIDRLLEEHHQPRHDDEIVPEAMLEDLDGDLLDGFLKRQRELHPRVLGTKSDEDILLDLHVVRRDESDGILRPTLAGLMALGVFPQKFFPRLNVSFTAYAGTTKADYASDGRRYLDSQNIIGSIPYMVEDTLNALVRNMRMGAQMNGAFRRDVPDYPLPAAREAIANALMHRDYSPESQGSQVQVNLYSDRLEILNPGGLYGNVTVETLGQSGVSSARNQFLSNILVTTAYPRGGYVVENLGTGYQMMEEELKAASMLPPIARNSTSNFCLIMRGERKKESKGGSTRGQDIDSLILTHIQQNGSTSARELSESMGLARSTMSNHLAKLVKEGMIEPTEPSRSPKQRYRLASAQENDGRP